MSRHRLVKGLDLEDELTDFAGGDGDDDYEDGAETEMTEEDKVQMQRCTTQVRNAFDPNMPPLSDKEIQDSLWYYYYDVGKTVHWLQGKHLNIKPNKNKQAPPVQSLLRPDDGDPPSTSAWSPVDSWSWSRPVLWVSASRFFHDSPWSTTIPPTRRANILIEPLFPKGRLLGGSSDVKMSKLQRLAAERARRQNERASLEESLRLSEGRPSSYAESLERLRRPIRPSSSQGSETLLDPAPVDQAPIGPQSNADTPIGSQSNTDNEAEKSPDSTPASDPVPVQPQGMPVPRLEDLRAAPSRFAIALLGLTPDGRRPDPEPSRYPAHIAQFTAYPTDFDMSAFLGPSPDDIALAAKGPRVGLKAASGPAGSAKSTKKIGDGVKAMTISAAPKPKKRNIDVLAEYNQSQSKPSVNFVVIGHVDHGKSTLLGRLLADLKVVDERTIEQYRREADKMGKSSFAWAWVLDQTSEERSRGITMDTAVNRFETDKASFTILDAPGHRDFIPKMIAGASQADFAVLVIDASPNAFESGIKGQTREHALLVRSMGVQRIIVAVNKMDTINWSHERFQEIQQQMLAFLTTAGFRNEAVSFLPCSGLNGDNVAQRGSENKNASWYTGPNLVELLEDSSPMAQALDKPFRMSIGDIFRGGVSYPLSVSGRLDAGTLQVGQKVKAMPSEESATIKAIERDDQSVDWAVAGHMVVLHLADIDPIHLKVGDVLCSLEHPIANVATLTIKALVFDHLTPMSVDVHRGHLHAPGRITKLVGVLNKASGAVVKKKPKIIKPGAVARIVVELDQSVPLEAPARIILRSNGETVAAGLVEEGRARVEVPDS